MNVLTIVKNSATCSGFNPGLNLIVFSENLIIFRTVR